MNAITIGEVVLLKSDMYSQNPLYLTVGSYYSEDTVHVHWVVDGNSIQTTNVHTDCLITLKEMERILEESKSS